jgi:hypothetical protein
MIIKKKKKKKKKLKLKSAFLNWSLYIGFSSHHFNANDITKKHDFGDPSMAQVILQH